MKSPDGYTPLPATVTVEVKIGVPVQVGLSGPKRLKVMVPVGLKPPERVATSLTGWPNATGGATWVTMAGWSWVTTVVSLGAPQGLVEPALLTSPL